MQDYINNLLSTDQTLAKGIFDGKVYPYEIIKEIKSYVLRLGECLSNKLFDQCGDGIWIAKNARVARSVEIIAPCIIDENAEIRHCAFIRGNAIIGKNAVVGNSTEIKNSILFNYAQTPHYNYVGDSILGYKAHLGAASITSNVKMDKSEVSTDYGNKKINSGLIKLGAVVGDAAEIGCGSVLNPGTVIGRLARIYPLSSVRGYVPERVVYKAENKVDNVR